MQNISLINQLYDWCVNVVPHFTDNFTNKYPIRALNYDLQSGLATATLDPADIIALSATPQYSRYVITDAEELIQIIDAIILPNLSLLITLNKTITLKIDSEQTLQGFLPTTYNTIYKISKRVSATQYEFSPLDFTILNNNITQFGFFTKYNKCKGYNGLKSVTINSVSNTITYPIETSNILGATPYIKDLGGAYGRGCGFLHNYHNNILLGAYHNYRDYCNQKKDYLFINSTDFNIRVNQEKNNTIDVAERQDSRTGHFSRLIMSFYVVYIKNVTQEVARSTNLNAVLDLYNVLYKISGIPFVVQSAYNPNNYTAYQLALGDVAPMADSDGMLFNTYQYTFTTTINYSIGNLLHDDVWTENAINNANLDILQNVSTDLSNLQEK